MNLVNIETKTIINKLPKVINFNGSMITNPSMETLNQAGWYVFNERAEVPKHHNVLLSEWAVINGVAVETLVTERKPINSSLLGVAKAFRDILRLHFGATAETDTAITEAHIKMYFALKRANGTLNATDTMDAMILFNGFETIKAWTMDNTSWSFPWEVLDNDENVVIQSVDSKKKK